MSSYRKGDLVTIRGQVQNVEGNFLMIALEGALDAAVPAMVSHTGVSLVRASIHDGDEVEGGLRVHSTIPNTPLVLLQLIDGDPSDPKSFSTAVRETLTLVRTSKDERPAPAPSAPTPAPAPAPLPATVETPIAQQEQAAPIAAAPEVAAPIAAAPEDAGETRRVDERSEGADDAGPGEISPSTTATLDTETVRRPDAGLADRFGGIASEALRISQGGSIASLGTVREETSPLKPVEDELVLRDQIEDERT